MLFATIWEAGGASDDLRRSGRRGGRRERAGEARRAVGLAVPSAGLREPSSPPPRHGESVEPEASRAGGDGSTSKVASAARATALQAVARSSPPRARSSASVGKIEIEDSYPRSGWELSLVGFF